MIDLSTDRWELKPENIEQVSADIAYYKPITKNSYLQQSMFRLLPQKATRATHHSNCSIQELSRHRMSSTPFQLPRRRVSRAPKSTAGYCPIRTGKVRKTEAPLKETLETLTDQEKAIRRDPRLDRWMGGP
jgi:hypothetical protein